jgi:hypothetical protein
MQNLAVYFFLQVKNKPNVGTAPPALILGVNIVTNNNHFSMAYLHILHELIVLFRVHACAKDTKIHAKTFTVLKWFIFNLKE